MFASTPGRVVTRDTFDVGRLEGVGAVWQLTVVDVATRAAVVRLIVGDETAAVAAGFLDHPEKALRKDGIILEENLRDNGPEVHRKAFTARVGKLGLVHLRIPPPESPTVTPTRAREGLGDNHRSPVGKPQHARRLERRPGPDLESGREGVPVDRFTSGGSACEVSKKGR
jgi:hypothetical protein